MSKYFNLTSLPLLISVIVAIGFITMIPATANAQLDVVCGSIFADTTLTPEIMDLRCQTEIRRVCAFEEDSLAVSACRAALEDELDAYEYRDPDRRPEGVEALDTFCSGAACESWVNSICALETNLTGCEGAIRDRCTRTGRACTENVRDAIAFARSGWEPRSASGGAGDSDFGGDDVFGDFGGDGAAGGGSGIFNVTWDNPLQAQFDGENGIENLIVAILNVLVVIAIPIITLMIIYAGFLYVTARGNADQIRTATRALTYAIIGGVLVIGAVAISEIIQLTIAEFRS